MSFLAKLSLGSTEYNVLTADYEISMPVDANSRPNGSPTAGTLNLTLESNSKNDIVEWTSNRQKKNGQITFYRRDSQSSLKTVAFNDGYCISMRETFDANSADPMRVTIRISAGEVKINNAATIKKPWSAMSAIAKGIGEAIGIDASSIINDPMVKSAESAYHQADDMKNEAISQYNSAKTTANAAKDTVYAAKDEAGKGIHDAGQEMNELKNAPDDAGKEISSFIP
jgi:hypothetical protein